MSNIGAKRRAAFFQGGDVLRKGSIEPHGEATALRIGESGLAGTWTARLGLAAAALFCGACGYKWVGWSSADYAAMAIARVNTTPETRKLGVRMRDALIERCLAGSGLSPVDSDGDLVLSTALRDYRESVVATGIDGRTERIQFLIVVDFLLVDREGKRVWALNNYQYSDQYAISTGQELFRDETVFAQDKALSAIADLAITNITLAIAEAERSR